MNQLYGKIPEHIEPLVILGNDNDYLVVYTVLKNEDVIEMLQRTIRILQEEEEVEPSKLTKH